MDETAARELIRTARQLADTLELSLPPAEDETAYGRMSDGQFDPEFDAPPFAPDPRPDAPERQRDLAVIILFGRLYAINARREREAERRDLVAIAKAAGYTDGRAWNRWSSEFVEREGAGKVLTETGHALLLERARRQDIVLPEDLTSWRKR